MTTSFYGLQADKPFGRTLEEFVSHSPAARDLQIFFSL